MNTWLTINRCKEEILNNRINSTKNTIQPYHDNNEDSAIKFKMHDPFHYEATINGLRVQTNYLVSIQAFNNETKDEYVAPKMVYVTTKSCK